MNAILRIVICALTMSAGVAPTVTTAQLAPHTPVSCSDKQFHLGQEMSLVTTKDGQLFKAATHGWQLLKPPAGWQQVSVTSAGVIYTYASATREIYRSTDDGATWQLSCIINKTLRVGTL